MLATLLLGLLACILKASVAAGWPARIDTKNVDGIILDGPWSNRPSLEDHGISEGMMGQRVDVQTLSALKSEMISVLKQVSHENSLLKEQVARDTKTLAALSSSVEVLQQKVEDLSKQTDTMNVAINIVHDFVDQHWNISDKLVALERKIERPLYGWEWIDWLSLSEFSKSFEERLNNVTAQLQHLSESVQRLQTPVDAVNQQSTQSITADNVDLVSSFSSTPTEETRSGEESGDESSGSSVEENYWYDDEDFAPID